MYQNIDNNMKKEKISPISFKIESYDGPLDLLIDLIKDKKMDILSIDISDLCFQYLEFINENLSSAKIDEVSEYLVMASYLIELKSKKILSLINEEMVDETELEIDRLRRQLFLYKQYRDVVSKFKARQSERVKFLAKPSDDFDDYIPKEMPEAPLPDSVPIQRIIKAWRKILMDNISEVDKDFSFSINVKTIDLEELQENLIHFIENNDISNIDFDGFVESFTRDKDLEYKCAIFFSLLHLSKSQIINLEQDANTEKIFISKNELEIVEGIHDEIIEAISQQQTISKLMQEQLLNKTKVSREDLKTSVDKNQNSDKTEKSKNQLDDMINEFINGKDDFEIDDFDQEDDEE
ncbi:MAG: segregation and condensation protein A [Mycoplasma sp.]